MAKNVNTFGEKTMSISESSKQLSLEEEVQELREKVEALEKKLEKKIVSKADIIKAVEQSLRMGSLRSTIRSTRF